MGRTLWLMGLMMLTTSLWAAERDVYLLYGDQTHHLTYEAFTPPRVVDTAASATHRNTPWDTLESYYRTMASMDDYDTLAPFLRKANGETGAVPADKAAFVTAAAEILSGKVTVHGYYTFEDYTIFLYIYEKSIPRLSGLPIRKFDGEEHFIVQDLALVNEFVGKMSAARWDIETLEQQYPAPEPPPPPPEEESASDAAESDSQSNRSMLWLVLAAVAGILVIAVFFFRK